MTSDLFSTAPQKVQNKAKIAKKNIWKKRISIGVAELINLIIAGKCGGAVGNEALSN